MTTLATITHEPRRQRYVVVLGATRRLSTYEDGESQVWAEAFAYSLARELEAKALAELEQRAEVYDSRAALAESRRAA